MHKLKVCFLTLTLLLTIMPFVAMAATFNVSVLADSFSPNEITITVGDTVIWTASVSTAGSITGDPTGTANGGLGADFTCQETLNSGILFNIGNTYSHTFLTAGDCRYASVIHYAANGQKGIIHVLSPSTTGDVGITDIQHPQLRVGRTSQVIVKIKNNSNSSQSRNVSLFLDGVNTGIGQLITLNAGSEGTVKFHVTPASKGNATLTAGLFPGDSNTFNDTRSETITIKAGQDKGKGKDKAKDKGK